ncbi:Uncharacterized protein Fot_06174 [Forsythia ovata]|uniref:Uncharacterized protein n=1 Tax=Forsythia ovata TaxID=205694 RepID=A0ABD1WS76_9LAMI
MKIIGSSHFVTAFNPRSSQFPMFSLTQFFLQQSYLKIFVITSNGSSESVNSLDRQPSGCSLVRVDRLPRSMTMNENEWFDSPDYSSSSSSDLLIWEDTERR